MLSNVTRTLAAFSAAAMLLAAHPATEAGYHFDPKDEDSVFFVESQAYFTASGLTGVGNVDNEAGEFMGWDAAEPTGTGGVAVAHGGSVLRSLVDEADLEKGQFTAEGTVTGILDSITLDLYYLDNAAAPFCTIAVAVDVTYDGFKILDMDNVSNNVDVQRNGGRAMLKLTDIHELLLSYQNENFDPVGDEMTEHTIRVLVSQYPICTEVIWQVGSADAPSSIRFNHDPSLADVSTYTEFSVKNPPVADAS